MTQRNKVKWFNSKQGYGFIIGPNGEDIFVHYKYIDMEGYKTLNKNQLVEYDIEMVEKDGRTVPQARNVKPLKFED
jgi:CspA family cold shock protein